MKRKFGFEPEAVLLNIESEISRMARNQGVAVVYVMAQRSEAEGLRTSQSPK
jgi:hypothetical protein